MAGTNNNIVKYYFEGDATQLEKSVKGVYAVCKNAVTNIHDFEKSISKQTLGSFENRLKTYTNSFKGFKRVKGPKAANLHEEVTYPHGGKDLSLGNSIGLFKHNLPKIQEDLKKYQGGELSESQSFLVQSLNNRLNQLKAFNRKANTLDAYHIKEAKRLLKEAFSDYNKLQAQKYSAKKNYDKLALQETAEKAKQQQALEDALTTSSQFKAGAQSDYLTKQVDVLKHLMPADAVSEIKTSVATYRELVQLHKEGKRTDEELAQATLDLDNVFNKYNVSLRTMKNTMQLGTKGIRTFNDLIKQSEQAMMSAVTSVGFWIQSLRRLANVVGKGITYYADYVESLNFLENATGDSADAMLDFANAQVRAFGLDPKTVNESAAMFYTFAKSMGFASDQSELVSQNLTKLAQDMASLHNVDLETATVKLRAALAGQSRALAVWGINVNDANVNEWLLSKGLNQTMTSMNEVSQAAARYAFILDKSTTAQGDLAKTLQSPANQLRILRVQLKLFVQNFGSIFTTVIVPIVRLLNNLLQPINAFFQGLTSLSAQGFSSSVGNMSESMEDLGNAAEDTEKKMAGLTGLDEINQLGTKKQAKQGGLDKQIESLLKGYDNLAGKASSMTQVFSSLGTAMAPIWDMFNNSGGISLISSLFEGFGLILQPLVSIFQWVGKFLSQLPEPLKNVISMITELAVGIFAVSTALTLVKMLTASKVFVQFISILKGMISAIVGVVGALWSKVTALRVSTLAEQLQGKQAKKSIALSILQTGKNWLETASWQAKALAMLGIAGAIAGVVVAGVSMYDAYKKKKEAEKIEVPDLENIFADTSMPTVPTESFTSVGEAFSSNIAPQANYAAVGGNQTIELNMDGDTLARALWPKLEDTKYQAGVNLNDY